MFVQKGSTWSTGPVCHLELILNELETGSKESIQLPEFFFTNYSLFPIHEKNSFQKMSFFTKKRSNSRKLKKTFYIPFLFIGVAFESKDGNQVSWEEEESQKHETSSCVINYRKTNRSSVGQKPKRMNAAVEPEKPSKLEPTFFEAWSFNEPNIELFSSLNALRKAFKLSYGLIDQKKQII